jgi:hypothetical protein
MDGTWQIVVEGSAAEAAMTALDEAPDLQLRWERADEAARDPATIAIIASVIGAVGGAVAIAEQLREWRDLWVKRDAGGGRVIERIILVDGDRRLLLDNASKEQIIEFIKKLP